MKICSRCKIEKEDVEFRLRYDKRGKGSQKRTYLNNTCKKCDAEISNYHYFKNKDNPEFHKNWIEKSRAYYQKHKEERSRKMKLKRQTHEYKEMMRKYRLKNKERIKKQEVITKKRYHEKNKNNITDKYCINQIRTQAGIEESDITDGMIEIERVKILMARISKAITNRPPTGKKKKCSCCNEIKDETEFYRIKKDSKRRISYCKKCSKLKSKAYRDKLKNNEKYSNITKSSF